MLEELVLAACRTRAKAAVKELITQGAEGAHLAETVDRLEEYCGLLHRDAALALDVWRVLRPVTESDWASLTAKQMHAVLIHFETIRDLQAVLTEAVPAVEGAGYQLANARALLATLPRLKEVAAEVEASADNGARRPGLHAYWPRYEAAGLAALVFGAVAAVAVGGLFQAPLWVGFAAGYLGTALLAALAFAADQCTSS